MNEELLLENKMLKGTIKGIEETAIFQLDMIYELRKKVEELKKKLNPPKELGNGYKGYWFSYFRRIKCRCGKKLNGYMSWDFGHKPTVQCYKCAIPSKRHGDKPE